MASWRACIEPETAPHKEELKLGSCALAVVIVAYHRYDLARASIDAYQRQLLADDFIVIADNTPFPSVSIARSPQVHWSDAKDAKGRNSCPAGGFACGMEYAFAHGARLVVLSDQDFVPSHDMLSELRKAHTQCPDAIICAVTEDPRTRRRIPSISAWRMTDAGTIQYAWLPNAHELSLCQGWVLTPPPSWAPTPPEDHRFTPLAFPQGMLVPDSVFRRIGTFDRKLFLGFEDYEYCLRAAKAGIYIRVAEGATGKHHQQWSSPVRILGIRFRLPGFSATRSAFTYRNTLWLSFKYLAGLARLRFIARETAALAVWIWRGPGSLGLRLKSAGLGSLAALSSPVRWSDSTIPGRLLDASRSD